jgi:DNA-binding NtrC family response regulator
MAVSERSGFRIRNEVIMVVEDDPGLCEQIQRSLELQGFPVVEAKGAAEAQDLYNFLERDIRLVITEPKIGGDKGETLRDFLNRIQRDVEVVYIEERDSAPRGRGGNGATLRPALRKPVDREELVRLVHGILR